MTTAITPHVPGQAGLGPLGGLMLAFFQIPNKVFAADGSVTDMAGADWQAVWGRPAKMTG